MENIFEQMTQITRAAAYPILVEQVKELKEENSVLRDRVIYLQNLITEYTAKMKANLEGSVSADDLPDFLFTKS